MCWWWIDPDKVNVLDVSRVSPTVSSFFFFFFLKSVQTNQSKLLQANFESEFEQTTLSCLYSLGPSSALAAIELLSMRPALLSEWQTCRKPRTVQVKEYSVTQRSVIAGQLQNARTTHWRETYRHVCWHGRFSLDCAWRRVTVSWSSLVPFFPEGLKWRNLCTERAPSFFSSYSCWLRKAT